MIQCIYQTVKGSVKMEKKINLALIEEFRLKNKWTKARFFSRCGIAKATLLNIQRGGRFTTPTLLKIAKTMNVEPEQLLITQED